MNCDIQSKELKERIIELEEKLEKLKKSNSLYKNIIKNLPFGIQIFDKNGYSFEFNIKQQELLGLPSLLEGIGKFNVLTDPYSQANGASAIFKEAYEGNKINHIHEYDLGVQENKWKTRKDIRTIHESIFPVKDENENIEFVVSVLQDITDEKKIEQDLLESEVRWKFAVEGNNDGLWDWNLITNQVFFSSQWKKMLGYSDDEISNNLEEWDKRIHPDDKEKVYRDVNRHINGESDVYENEHRVLCKDGTFKWILDRGKIITYTNENKPARMIGTHSDITDRINSQVALKLSEKKFSKAFHTNPAISILSLFETGEYIEVNQAFLDKLGYTMEETIGHKSIDIHTVDNNLRKKFINKLQKNGSIRSEETNLKTKSGKLLPVLFSAETFEIDNIKYIYTSAIDISKRKKVEEELNKHRALLAINEELSEVGAWEFNLLSGESYWTEGMYKIHELQHDKNIDLFDASIKCYLPENRELLQKSFNKCIQEGIAYEYTFPFITHKNNKRWIKTKTQPIYENDKIVKIIGSIADVTELKEDQMKLRELNEAKEKFFSIIAHDLRNPFNAILGLTEVVYNKMKQKEYEQTGRFLTLLYQSAREFYNFLDNLLQWSRIQTQRLEYKPSEIKLNLVLEELSDMLYANIEIKKIDFKISSGQPKMIYADRFMLETILRNLLTNAIKFTPEHGRIVLSARHNVNETEISVEDTGIGMQKENLNKLFNSEISNITSGTNNEKGSGLGLILCREFVEKHGGKIWAESQEGKGSKFTFTIPDKR